MEQFNKQSHIASWLSKLKAKQPQEVDPNVIEYITNYLQKNNLGPTWENIRHVLKQLKRSDQYGNIEQIAESIKRKRESLGIIEEHIDKKQKMVEEMANETKRKPMDTLEGFMRKKNKRVNITTFFNP